MSEETKTLEIFKPLKTYFNLLCTAKPQKCMNYDDCKELMDIITREDCDPNGKFTENFLNALSWFAAELKKADSPIGSYTIRNNLKKIFVQAYNSNGEKNNDQLIISIVDKVNSAEKSFLSGFKMNQDNGEGKTYEEILREVVYESKDKTIGQVFGLWITKSFGELYKKNEEYFQKNIKPIILSDNFDLCQKSLLDNFFEIKTKGGEYDLTIDEYISDKTNYEDNNVRLNLKTNPDKTEALIIQILPKDVRQVFNEYLITPPTDGNPVFYLASDCIEDKLTSKESESKPKLRPIKRVRFKFEDEVTKEELKVQDPKAVLDWFKTEAQGVSKISKEDEVIDSVDNVPYSDSSGEFKFPSSFENVINYKDNWRADLTGRLWKKDSTGKFVEYTDTDLQKDAKSFQETESFCGKLCIFQDPIECSKFFERMMKRDSYSMNELSEIINNKYFVSNYNDLKKNIVSVNPLFVVGTLRMFGFDKYTELRDDGTKVVKIESFTRWWNRHKDKLQPLTGEKHKNNPSLNPEPPANLELFFKLLILYINNNEFILNPQTKQLITTKEVSVKKIRPFPKLIDAFGNSYVNKNYDKEMAIYEGRAISSSSRPESLSNLVDIMRKNSQISLKTTNLGLSENRLNLSTLLGLMIGITNGGHIRLGKESPFSTGKGYLYGGSETMLPCSKNAHEIYAMGIEALKKKDKKLADYERNAIDAELTELTKLEHTVYNKLNTLARYVKVINVMNDEAKNDKVTNDIMARAVNDYESNSNKLASKSDSIISMLLKKIFDEKSESKSYYNKLI